MPRYRLTQSQESAGKDRNGYRPCATYFDRECHSDDWALGYACGLLDGHSCRIGWRDGSVDIYDRPAAIQRDSPADAVHIATLTRIDLTTHHSPAALRHN